MAFAMKPDDTRSTSSAKARFATTRWSVVLAARDPQRTDGRQALEVLCQAYWYPLYAYVRRQGSSPQDAADLTQEFFAQLLDKDWLSDVARDKGRFRDFLLASMRHFVSKQRRRALAQKRGGGRKIMALDIETAEGRFQLEPVDSASPDRAFDRQWALTLLASVSDGLRQRYAAEGKSQLFAVLEPTLAGGRGEQPYAALAGQLGMTEGAVRVAVIRLRRRYRDALRSQIGDTVSSEEEIDDELRHLMKALEG
jgi:DNA-directed RNA polymerase specialized sigma24 family protein